MITANTPQNLIPIVLAIDCSIPTTAEELWMIPVTNTPEKKPSAGFPSKETSNLLSVSPI